MRFVFYRTIDDPDARVLVHPTQLLNGLQRRKNPACMHLRHVDGETCNQRIDGCEVGATRVFLPRLSVFGECERVQHCDAPPHLDPLPRRGRGKLYLECFEEILCQSLDPYSQRQTRQNIFWIKLAFQALHQFHWQLFLLHRRAAAIINHAIPGPRDKRRAVQAAHCFNDLRWQH